ncbi:hypothetical protein ACFSQD_10505 [Flavihumibacter stibioxidans]|uniref:MG2 domain-containing protein n=1 Tax=Flavihumibacter stibioxidans TaxID=1834163 RepID=A0ABR7MBR7_9BACT|nr:hypothetical protein [Flavihumibacter stibioxidans]MBC6491949.1 hypothetical protein [Flavihumibacter stibioxidans]
MKPACFLKPILSVLLLLPALLMKAQVIDSVLLKLESQYPQEKIHLQFDKGAYNPGETIWLKAYLMSGHLLSGISKNVYTELVNGNGQVLQKKVSPVLMSGAAAAFDLPADLKDSVVFVRAYTRWMLNFDTAFLYVKAIPILSATPAQPATAKQVSSPQYFLELFPEGGDLVQDVPSRIAFKATDKRGWPVAFSGDLLTGKGAKIESFSSTHNGMGFFNLTPKAGETYKITWKDPSGKQQQVMVPAARPNGIVLELNHTSGGIQFNIKRKDGVPSPLPVVQVIAQTQQQLIYRAKVNLTKSALVTAVIPTEGVPAGIVQVTIFSEDNKPLAERIIFLNNQDYYFITDLNVPLKGLDKRDRNVIQVDVPDTIPCNLSMSITDADINPAQPGENDIYSQILLASDIKGYVHNPGYYFSSEADTVAQHLDLVMMTNGWRRFRWEDAIAGKFPVIKHLPEDYLTMEGSVTGLTKSELVNQEITGIINLKNGSQQFLTIPVQQDGKFYVPGMIFYDTAKLYYQFSNDKNKLLTTKALIDVKNNLLVKGPAFSVSPKWTPSFNPLDPLAQKKNQLMVEKNRALLDEQRKVQTLAGVTVVAKQKSKAEKMDEQYASGFFKGQEGYTFITEDDPFANGSMSILNYLQGKVPGLQITGAGTQMSLSWRGGTPVLYVNEMQGDVNMIQNTPMTDVAMIKVFRPPFFGAPGGGSGGAIAVYTKKGAALNDNVKGLDFASIPGYVPEKQFYSPDYMKYETEHKQTDNRTTLYWNPFIITDKNTRRILYTVYNNDISKRLRIVIEGVNADGKLTRIEKIIE